jgi:acyl transferase domain-containing protein
MVVKTGCSASLVALHEACRALQQRDCSAALVSGTSLLMGPHIFEIMTDEGVLSPEGSCKTFDASADGFARAEGINTVFLKRITDAIRDGNPIRAVIRNSGNNCDGKTQGITLPRSDTQESLIRHVYAQARLDPSHTGFFECHGTGTAVGDPIECAAVGNVFGKEGIHIGSVSPIPTDLSENLCEDIPTINPGQTKHRPFRGRKWPHQFN